jgi:hypothetical protein
MTHTLEEIAPDTHYIASESVAVQRLDDLRGSLLRPGEQPFLKIDVQGFEREVLLGAEDAMKSLRGIELELSMIQLYKGQPLVHEILGELHTAGFTPFSFEPAFMDLRNGRVLQVDAVLVRR